MEIRACYDCSWDRCYFNFTGVCGMNKYYFTFGQSHRHPKTNQRMKDYWIEVIADTLDIAIEKMSEVYGSTWCMHYTGLVFTHEYYPNGCYEVIQ